MIYGSYPKSGPQTFVPDDNYDLIQPKPSASKKGVQCGQCGMKFDYGTAYGFCCGNINCPCQVRVS